MTPRRGRRVETLWSQSGAADRQMLDYTIGNDRAIDARLLRWDVIGSLGQGRKKAGHAHGGTEGRMPQELALKNIRLFAERVIPAFAPAGFRA